VLSADRPMTESEVKFLTYIRKWGKKVVFVLNKVDTLESVEDVEEVRKFVQDNAERFLVRPGIIDSPRMVKQYHSIRAVAPNMKPLSAGESFH